MSTPADAAVPVKEHPTVSTGTDASTPQTRRERRAAERARGGSTARRSRASATSRRSPIPLITALVGAAAAVLIGALVLVQGGGLAGADSASLRTPTTATPATLADGRTLGKVDAPVTLDVWSDFQCPVCGQFARSVVPALVRDYVTRGTLRIAYHDAAFQGERVGGAYDESVEAAAGARCAVGSGGYWSFHDWLFANQSGENAGAFADARLQAIARSAGLDLTAWDACRATGEQQRAVRSETRQAVAQGITATPTMVLNGETIVGLRSVSELGAKIEAAAAPAALR